MRAAVNAKKYGLVVRLARRAGGLSQGELGAQCGYSAATISRFETGARPLTDITTLRVFARALDLPPETFGLAPDPRPPDSAPPGVVPTHPAATAARVGGDLTKGGDEAVRRRELLAAMTGLTGVALLNSAASANAGTDDVIAQLESVLLNTGGSALPTPISELRNALSEAHTAFEMCRYRELGGMLPALVDAARTSRDAASGTERDQLSMVLSEAYRLASELCVKLNEDGMAWVAADRAYGAAHASGDPSTIAAASRWIGIAMRRQGHHDGAVSLLTKTALSLGGDSGDQQPHLLAAYGSLLCTAAYSSAQNGNRGRALELIGEAEQAAARIGDQPAAGSEFSTTNVAVYRIGVHTALGDSGAALTYARNVNQHLLPTPERHARFCVDTARAWFAHGRVDRAYQVLRAAERYAPEELRRPSVRTLVSDLLYTPGTRPTGLRELAGRCGAV
jgi:transcriptional regulator with XRE-family HTH domain